MAAREAIVVRTGQRAESDFVCGRLGESGLRAIECCGAIEACVHVLRFPDPAPQAVFIGTDWLAREDYALIGYLRETWPSVPIVLHGDVSEIVPDRGGPTLVCSTFSELKDLLSGSFEQALEAVRRAASAAIRLRGSQRAPGAPSFAPAAAFEAHEGLEGGAEIEPAVNRAEARRGVVGSERERANGGGPSPPRTILTEEELDALLRDSGV